jgi:diguanylate cyclase
MFGKPKTDQWELAYRELIMEFEAKEREWSKLEDGLRRAAAQLGIAAMGQSDALDDALAPIVQFARTGTGTGTGTGSIDADLARLGDTLKRAEVAQTKHPGVDVRREPRQAPSTAASARPTQATTTEPLIAEDLEAEVQAPAASADAQASTAAAIEAPAHAAGTPLQHVDIAVIVDALTARLAKIREFEDLAAQFAQRSRDLNEGDWSTTLNGLADGIAQVIGSLNAERQELESFLETVKSQLAQFEKWTNWHLSDAKLRQQDSHELEAAVSQHMQGIHDEMEKSADLGDLKSAVQRRLQSVADRFRAFRESEAKRYDQSEQRNRELADEVGRLQEKTEVLSKICGSQQDRLMYDALTRVHSRYAYEQRLVEEYRRWRRNGGPLAYALWDIDKFKSINDTYGHDAGDRLLRRIGRIIQAHKRGEDFLARIGGEEFALLLPQTDAHTAMGLADRLREVIASTPFHYRGSPEHITLSCGVTEFREGDTPITVYKRADEALYEAKRSGRNRCVEN